MESFHDFFSKKKDTSDVSGLTLGHMAEHAEHCRSIAVPPRPTLEPVDLWLSRHCHVCAKARSSPGPANQVLSLTNPPSQLSSDTSHTSDLTAICALLHFPYCRISPLCFAISLSSTNCAVAPEEQHNNAVSEEARVFSLCLETLS